MKQARGVVTALLVFASLSAGLTAVAVADETGIRTFARVASYSVPGGVAEIVSGTPDGNTLVYVDSGAGEVGIVDINDTSQPEQVATIPVGGVPTSVSISPDGVWAFVGVNTSYKVVGEAPEITPGKLVVIEFDTGELAHEIELGNGPDLVASAMVGDQLVVVVAIENEPAVVDEAGLLTDAEVAGLDGDISGPGYVQIVSINQAAIAESSVQDVLADAGLYFVDRRSGDVVEPDAGIAQMVADYAELVGPLLNRLIGTAEEDITREQNEAGESALGNLIADAQRWKMDTELAFMNPGGIRDDILAGEVTWRELFTVQPFGNDMVTLDLT